MPVSLSDLESRRATLLSLFGSLGDLRSGSISNTNAAAANQTAVVTGPVSPLMARMRC
jgi:hypothetical protein